jgi:hypothetical protein
MRIAIERGYLDVPNVHPYLLNKARSSSRVFRNYGQVKTIGASKTFHKATKKLSVETCILTHRIRGKVLN